MRKVFVNIGDKIRGLVDFFYPPFKPYMSVLFFRYAACGGANIVFDLLLYFISYNFILEKQMLQIGSLTISPHIASLCMVFPISTFSGFLLQKYVTFSHSELKGRIQLLRYFMVVLVNLFINYIGLKFFVDFLHFYPTPSKMLVTVVAIAFSYFSQKRYTFN